MKRHLTVVLKSLALLGLLPVISQTLGAEARAQDYIAPSDLKIIYSAIERRPPQPVEQPTADNPPSQPQPSWSAACQELGEALTVGKGPWGLGAFTKFSCFDGETKVSGDDTTTPWVLTFEDTEKFTRWTLTHTTLNQTLVSLNLDPSAHNLSFLQDQEFIDLLALTFLDAMPFAMAVLVEADEDTQEWTGRYQRAGKSKTFKFALPTPPEQLVFYRLRFDAEEQMWRSANVFTGKRLATEPPEIELNNGLEQLQGGSITYQLAAKGVKDNDELFLAHYHTGPNSHSERLQSAVSDAHGKMIAAVEGGGLEALLVGGFDVLANLLKDTSASGYIGFRFGKQILPGNSLLEQANFVGVLVEIRGGPAEGLRYYYDAVPLVEETRQSGLGNDLITDLNWSRHVLGFSWGYETDFWINNFTIDPKIGIWNFFANLPTAVNEDDTVKNVKYFELSNAMSVALEIGAERLMDWYTLRGWYSLDFASTSDINVSSNRFGLDAYYNVGSEFSLLGWQVNPTLMAFYIYEAITLTLADPETPAPGQEEIFGTDYTGAYVGLGGALSW